MNRDKKFVISNTKRLSCVLYNKPLLFSINVNKCKACLTRKYYVKDVILLRDFVEKISFLLGRRSIKVIWTDQEDIK